MQTERRGKRYSPIPIRVPFRRVSHLRSRAKCLYTSLVTVSEKTDVGSIYDPQTGRKISILDPVYYSTLFFIRFSIDFSRLDIEQATIFFLYPKFLNNNIVNLEINETN